jgi:hypothetical protein
LYGCLRNKCPRIRRCCVRFLHTAGRWRFRKLTERSNSGAYVDQSRGEAQQMVSLRQLFRRRQSPSVKEWTQEAVRPRPPWWVGAPCGGGYAAYRDGPLGFENNRPGIEVRSVHRTCRSDSTALENRADTFRRKHRRRCIVMQRRKSPFTTTPGQRDF